MSNKYVKYVLHKYISLKKEQITLLRMGNFADD